MIAARYTEIEPVRTVVAGSKTLQCFLATWQSVWTNSEWAGEEWRDAEGKPNFVLPFQKAIAACLTQAGLHVKEEAEIRLDLPTSTTRSLDARKFIDLAVSRHGNLCDAAVELSISLTQMNSGPPSCRPCSLTKDVRCMTSLLSRKRETSC